MPLVAKVAAVLAMAAASAASAQPPPSWSTGEGRWNDWKAASFATSAAHYAALKAAAKGGAPLTWTRLPDWRGVWDSADAPFYASIIRSSGAALGWGTPRWRYTEAKGLETLPPVVNGKTLTDAPLPETPTLTPAGETALIASLKLGQLVWDYLYDCLPVGYPRWWTEPYLREFIITPAQTWMIGEYESEARRIYTDGRDHVPAGARSPSWEGDSIGFWDGDTLVVHTIGLRFGNWNRDKPPYSDKAETVEQIRKTPGGLIEARLTVYDPVTLQKPWRLIFGSQKANDPLVRANQYSCAENNNFVPMAGGGVTSRVRGDADYKEPSNLRVFHPEARQAATKP